MATIEKKENKLKKFVEDHAEVIMICGYGVCSYALGLAIGYFTNRPSKEVRNFFKESTRGAYILNHPADGVYATVSEIFGDATTELSKFGIQPNDLIVNTMFAIAKSET